MSRLQLEDRLNYCRREMLWLESIKTCCHSCEHKTYLTNHCKKFDQDVPAEFMASETCPEWSFDDVPF